MKSVMYEGRPKRKVSGVRYITTSTVGTQATPRGKTGI